MECTLFLLERESKSVHRVQKQLTKTLPAEIESHLLLLFKKWNPLNSPKDATSSRKGQVLQGSLKPILGEPHHRAVGGDPIRDAWQGSVRPWDSWAAGVVHRQLTNRGRAIPELNYVCYSVAFTSKQLTSKETLKLENRMVSMDCNL